ncbi:MAG: prepilin-type N-terminal cleavage/methylation domain-containing protein [Rubrivivax sp.]|nr:prepilin-type N-terminal cleavage/methylation domain-containing protein [Rubrivivax sp.]
MNLPRRLQLAFSARRPLHRAFTLIELMVVIALIGVILVLAAPSFNDMIGMQRLRAINDQLVTDMQYMRGEAVSRNQYMGFIARSVPAETMSCYTIFSSSTPLVSTSIDPTQCNCTNAIGAACTAPQRELRTAQIPRGFNIDLRFPPNQGGHMVASPINGGIEIRPPNSALFSDLEFCVEVRRSPRGRLRTSVSMGGRTSQCSPDGSVPGVPTCPPYDAALKNCQAAT